MGTQTNDSTVNDPIIFVIESSELKVMCCCDDHLPYACVYSNANAIFAWTDGKL